MKINSLCEFAIPPDESFNLPPKKKKKFTPQKNICVSFTAVEICATTNSCLQRY